MALRSSERTTLSALSRCASGAAKRVKKNALPLRPVARSNVKVTALGFGAAPIGELNVAVSDKEAIDALQVAWDSGVRYFDTAPWYGRGLSELRLGRFLREQLRADPKAEFVLSTKVGRYLRPAKNPDTYDGKPWIGGLPQEVIFDYTYDGIMRGYEESLQRLWAVRPQMLFVHDLDSGYHKDRLKDKIDELAGDNGRCRRGGGWKALEELRKTEGIKSLGFGLNIREEPLISEFLKRFDPDLFLIAGSYTLLDQAILDKEFRECDARGIGYIIGAPFSSGILAANVSKLAEAKYMYGAAPAEKVEKARRIAAVAKKHGVSLPSAALNFTLGHPSVAAVIPGANNSKQAKQNSGWVAEGPTIPTALWEELKREGLLHQNAPCLSLYAR